MSNALGQTLSRLDHLRWWLLAAIISLFAVALGIRNQLNLEWSLESVRSLVQSQGIWGPIAYIGILSFRFLVLIPSSLLLLAGGILFGPIYGTLYAGLGLLGSGLWKYGLLHLFGTQFVLKKLPRGLGSWVLDFAHRRTSAWALAGICAYPFLPKHLFQVGAILSGMAFSSYMLAISIGSFARAGCFAWLGESIYAGTHPLFLTFGFAAALAVPMCIKPWRRWMLAPLSKQLRETQP